VRVVVAAALAACVGVGAFLAGRAGVAGEAAPPLQQRSTPGVIAAIRDVARLETTEFHIEKVVEVTDAQSRLWGLVAARDALLLVAVGDVVAGIDLAAVRDDDVRVDGAARTVSVRLPAPQIVSSRLDPRATHVYSRSTDVLATRNEALEGDARRLAEEQMRAAAVDAGILDRARVGAERTLRALLRSFGYADVAVDWADRG